MAITLELPWNKVQNLDWHVHQVVKHKRVKHIVETDVHTSELIRWEGVMWFVKMAKSFYFLLGHSYWCQAPPRKRLSGAWGPNYKRHVVTPSSRLSGGYSARQNSRDIHRGKEETPKEELLQSAQQQQQQQQQKMYFPYFSYFAFDVSDLFLHAWFSPLFSFYHSLLCIMLFISDDDGVQLQCSMCCVRAFGCCLFVFLWRRVEWWIQVIIQISSFK